MPAALRLTIDEQLYCFVNVFLMNESRWHIHHISCDCFTIKATLGFTN